MQNIAVIGSNGAVGKALIAELESSGCNIARGARDGTGPQDTLPIEATDEDSVAAFFKDANEAMGGIDGLAVCVGSILIRPVYLT